MTRRPIPGWFVVPAQPVRCDRPPAGRGWVHEIKHDGYRVLVRRDGAVVRIYSRNAINWTDRFSTIATVAATLEAHSFTIDGEAVVIGLDGIAQFDELRRRNGAERAMLYGFDLIELNGVDLRPARSWSARPPWRINKRAPKWSPSRFPSTGSILKSDDLTRLH